MINKFITVSAGFMLMASLAIAQQKPFTIDGNIKNKTDGFVYMFYSQNSDNNNLDSSIIGNGHFSFHGHLSGPNQVTIVLNKKSQSPDQYLQLYIVPGDMQLSLDANNFRNGAVLKGSPVQAEADALDKAKEPIMAKIKPISEAYTKAIGVYREAVKAKKDQATLQSLKDVAEQKKDAIEIYSKQAKEIEMQFMDKNPASYVTASLLRYRISGMPLQQGEERYNKLSEVVKSSSLGKELKKNLDELRSGSPGSKAFVFGSKELRGEPLSLADYKGKYVLVDFWASWCVPCRAGNPHLLSIYKKYKDKGFEIIGVSDDDSDPDAWKKAVEKDGIGVWKHVLRGLKRVEGPEMFDRSASIADKYGINSLPTKILIDPNGMIIGRYGGGGENEEAMDKKLSEIFGG